MFEKIFLVAGHGGNNDPGAVAKDGTTERELVQAICRKALPLFGEKGIGIGIETPLTITQKTNAVNAVCKKLDLDYTNALLVSVHADWSGATEGVGAYHFAKSDESEDFAQVVVDNVAKAGNRRSLYNNPDTASRFGRIGIVRDTDPLAMLLECGSLKADENQNDGLELLKSEEGQQKIAELLVEGVCRYARWEYSPEEEKTPETPKMNATDATEIEARQKAIWEICETMGNLAKQAQAHATFVADIARKYKKI